jgi:hypothetical protein
MPIVGPTLMYNSLSTETWISMSRTVVIIITILRALRVGHDSLLYRLSAGFYFWRAVDVYYMEEDTGASMELGAYALVAVLGAWRWK